jgi:hypothetical protein
MLQDHVLIQSGEIDQLQNKVILLQNQLGSTPNVSTTPSESNHEQSSEGSALAHMALSLDRYRQLLSQNSSANSSARDQESSPPVSFSASLSSNFSLVTVSVSWSQMIDEMMCQTEKILAERNSYLQQVSLLQHETSLALKKTNNIVYKIRNMVSRTVHHVMRVLPNV